jgi:hypothetical protein
MQHWRNISSDCQFSSVDYLYSQATKSGSAICLGRFRDREVWTISQWRGGWDRDLRASSTKRSNKILDGRLLFGTRKRMHNP